VKEGTSDFVNARFVNSFIRHMQMWPRLLGEMWRLTRAGGVLRVTEADDAGTSNGPAFGRLKALAISFQHSAAWQADRERATAHYNERHIAPV
jgi:ubiquinone/menaquinone biosynthesis C-methylase UbiE